MLSKHQLAQEVILKGKILAGYPPLTKPRNDGPLVKHEVTYHIPTLAHLLLPGHGGSLDGGCKSPAEYFEHEHPFQEAETRLATAVLLIDPLPNASALLMVDPSTTGVGAVLQQHEETDWSLLGFFSKRLKATDARNSTFGREMLGNHSSVKQFRFLS
ncbi:uncharacterized protein LOC142570518 [Dermacentor variabilis]|uniref:uncharacterized protein LOC142570518 n=1 Tax=Dermacentor variabilis TaxID=34621 RepID=UPI003F5BD5B0